MTVLKEKVIAAARARTPVTYRERECIERFLSEIERLADPFNEHARDDVGADRAELVAVQVGDVGLVVDAGSTDVHRGERSITRSTSAYR